MITRTPILRLLMMAVAMLIMLSCAQAAPVENKTTIILIDAKPVLVQLGPKGEIIDQYIDVPEYFRSYKTHERLVNRYKKRVGILSVSKKKFDESHFLAAKQVEKQMKLAEQEAKWLESLDYLTSANVATHAADQMQEESSVTTKEQSYIELYFARYGIHKEPRYRERIISV